MEHLFSDAYDMYRCMRETCTIICVKSVLTRDDPADAGFGDGR
jgi:hypothetical protein